MNYILLDIVVNIQPSDVLVSIGDKTEFSCNFTGQYRVRRDKVTWLKGNFSEKNILKINFLLIIDGKPLPSDASRITVSTELPNATVTVLQIMASRPSDGGSYRCSDGHSAQSKEAKLYLRDGSLNRFLHSLSSSSFIFKFSSYRTVFCLYIFLLLFL